VSGLVNISSALVLLVTGIWLLYDGVSGRDSLEMETIAGATLMSVAVVSSALLLRNRLTRKRGLGKWRVR